MLDELADSVSELRESVSEVRDSVSELRESVSEVKDSVSELRESVSEVKDSVEGVRITAQALLQIAAQQQRENEARQAEIAEIRQRQEDSDKRFEVLLSEVRYLIRQIKPDDRQSQS
jgi:methyl-accepting chemotaxis protein